MAFDRKQRALYRQFGSWRWIGFMFLVVVGGLLSQPLETQAQNCQYWVAPPPEGNDGFPGTFTQPWATLDYAAENVPDNNCTVWFKNGIYMGENVLSERFTTPTTFAAHQPYKAVLEHNGLVVSLNGILNMIFEGFEFRHSGVGPNPYVVKVDRADDQWSENITFRNNIFHDSFNNDLLKIHNGVRFAIVENNIFYNQGVNEQHMDVNSVTDVKIQDNIFFNDFAGSGRPVANDTKHFIVIKDSNEDSDGLRGSERITVRRNIFLNWEGGFETFLQVGNDGKPYHEAETVVVENNLLIGNSSSMNYAAFGVRGAKDITFANNTIVGDFPSDKAFAFYVSITEQNPENENIFFYNNIWSDPTGTMGSNLTSDPANNRFSLGDPEHTIDIKLDYNLYWNGSEEIPNGTPVSPLVDDPNRIVANPLLNTNHDAVVLPRWDGTIFSSGNRTIRQEFIRLVEEYGKIEPNSPAIDQADPASAPTVDILGHRRLTEPDLGAYEYDGQEDGGAIYLPVVRKE
ncbi:MAG: right-handed parallel beta-helix repeat-containing protein [Anaerolineae bacterium]|nr:right-handed parallel beta-helix repeat-containing protein [Anaerolineae bacterium]